MVESVSARSTTSIDQRTRVNRLPRATYRLQLRSDFGFHEVKSLLDYLQTLGISDLYLSPLFHSREDSPHGYDVVDHGTIEPTFGDIDSFSELAGDAVGRGMGILLDIVPNHMGINDPSNRYWNDVLENGPHARYASFFDIDWDPPGSDFRQRLLLPFLGKAFGEALEAGELQVQRLADSFVVSYFERRFPLTPSSWTLILQDAVARLPQSTDDDSRNEMLSIVTQLERLAGDRSGAALEVEERYREQTVARRRLRALLETCTHCSRAVDEAIAELNGEVGNPSSFDRLEALLRLQHYRLAFWQVATDEINYRRFFDINDLAAIRVEETEVYDVVHRFTFDLLDQQLITGLRIDHCDGLLDPTEYFKRLQATYSQLHQSDEQRGRDLYIVAEKILSETEALPTDWEISGTTGYEFLNQVSGLFVDSHGVKQLQQLYADLISSQQSPRDVAYNSKLTILQDAMASELHVLASRLFRLARASRVSYDFTMPVLLRALREIIACFTVYRTYTRPIGWNVNAEDEGRIREGIRWAKIRNPTMPWPAFDFIGKVLLLEVNPRMSDELKAAWRQLAVKLQQVTGPVTAKGIEDTSFYRYYPLISLNEVGAELGSEGMPPETLHRTMQRRVVDWPRALSATATHDTKRGEDMRTRLHVLSEMPERYVKAFNAFLITTSKLTTTIEGRQVPDINECYFIHQTLIGTWPVEGASCANWEHYPARLKAYFTKAFREAKQHTSWRMPIVHYEEAIQKYLDEILNDESGQYRRMIDSLVHSVAAPGYINSLSQVILKATLPGVPDFYQGCEFWDFHLVDPDNRQPVDYTARQKLLDEWCTNPVRLSELFEQVGKRWDDRLKCLVTYGVLQLRQDYWDLFASGDYQPVSCHGALAKHLFAFTRSYNQQQTLVVVPRLPYGLAGQTSDHSVDSLHSYLGEVWGDTYVELPPEAPAAWRDALSGSEYFCSKVLSESAATESQPARQGLSIKELFREQPFAVLVNGEDVAG